MKYMFVSDVHGNVDRFNEVLEIFNEEKADKLVLLGDTSASMSRNDNEIIIEKINNMKNMLEVIRGNCDSRDFEEMLEFEIFDMDNLYINGKVVSITHGHYYNYYNLPYNCGEIFIQGHTHVPMLQKVKDKILANPGSVSRPRGTDLRCYIVLDDKKIALKTLTKELVKEIIFAN